MGLCEQLDFANTPLKISQRFEKLSNRKKMFKYPLEPISGKNWKRQIFSKKSLLPKQFELFSSLAGEKMTVLMITAITPFRLTRSRHVIISEKSN